MEYVEDNFAEEQALPPAFAMAPRRIIATPALLAVFLLIYALMFVVSRGWDMSVRDLVMQPFGTGLLSRFGALTTAPLSEGREIWRLVTGAFVHLNLIHLAFNSYCVFSLGRVIETYFGVRRMFSAFLVCSVVANIFTISVASAAPVHVGTLGGLFGLDGMVLGFALRNRSALPAKSFRWMVGSALFWPVFWVALSIGVFRGQGGVWGLVAGFAAGAALGLVFEAARFKGKSTPSFAVSFLFVAAVVVCIACWLNVLTGALLSGVPHGERDAQALKLRAHACREGGFEIPVPPDMTVTQAKSRLSIGQGAWAFCRVSWRDAGSYDDPESLAKAAVSDRRLEGSADDEISEVDLREYRRLRVGGEDAVFFALSMLVRGREGIYAQAVLIHEESIYTITFNFRAEDELRERQMDAMIDSFRFTGPPQQE